MNWTVFWCILGVANVLITVADLVVGQWIAAWASAMLSVFCALWAEESR